MLLLPLTPNPVIHSQCHTRIRAILGAHIAPVELAMVTFVREHHGAPVEMGDVLELVLQVGAHAAVTVEAIGWKWSSLWVFT